MSFPTTDRLKRWYQTHEVHFAVAKPGGAVEVGLAPTVSFPADDVLLLELPAPVWATVAEYLEASRWVALHPGGLGAVKAPYQLKGLARLEDLDLAADGTVTVPVDLKELYITKPGPEAGQRVDQWPREQLVEFERQLGWLRDENA